jgi:SAM-dependent methyltransferase
MHDNFSRSVRGQYLQRAREFLLRGRKHASVLELGCGSGWVGQMIAGPDLTILGVDFSEEQIRLAQKNAEMKRLARYCRYALAEGGGWSSEAAGVEGVLIHCYLHHLSGDEVKEVLDELKSKLAPHTPLWFYEPAFYLRDAPARVSPLVASERAAGKAECVVSQLTSFYTRLGLLDWQTRDAFHALTDQAERMGWYLSPKEVPFDVDAFSAEIQKRFTVLNGYWATVRLIGWVYQSNLLRSKLLRGVVAKVIVPVLARVDRRIAADAGYVRRELVAPNYAFRVWECTT